MALLYKVFVFLYNCVFVWLTPSWENWRNLISYRNLISSKITVLNVQSKSSFGSGPDMRCSPFSRRLSKQNRKERWKVSLICRTIAGFIKHIKPISYLCYLRGKGSGAIEDLNPQGVYIRTIFTGWNEMNLDYEEFISYHKKKWIFTSSSWVRNGKHFTVDLKIPCCTIYFQWS